MRKLVLATQNSGKIKEFERLLAEFASDIQVLGLRDFPDMPDIPETGESFIENSLLKARGISKFTNLPALADDSGLCIDYLNGDPGIYSARWAGTHGDDQANLEKLLSELKDVSDDKRTAHFTCVAALAMPDGRTHVEEGLFHGQILHAPVGQEGFGYDPIFQPLGMSISSAQMSPQEKDAVSHRGKALRLIAPHVIQMLRSLG